MVSLLKGFKKAATWKTLGMYLATIVGSLIWEKYVVTGLCCRTYFLLNKGQTWWGAGLEEK